MEKTQSSRNRDSWQEILTITGLSVLVLWLLFDRPRQEYALPIIGLAIVSLLFEIRGKLEAIRFMMAYDFDKKLDQDYQEKLDRDDDLLE
jgi:hypothetical protein